MSKYKPVPCSAAKDIAESYAKSQVLILTWDPEHVLVSMTTYGVTAIDKENAAALGDKVAAFVGCDMGKLHEFEDFHKDYNPAVQKEAIDLLRLLARHESPYQVRIEKLLATYRSIVQGHRRRQ
jgi:hypothetical protein